MKISSQFVDSIRKTIFTHGDEVAGTSWLTHFIRNGLSVLKVGTPKTAYITEELLKEALNTLVKQSDFRSIGQALYLCRKIRAATY